MEQDGGQVAAAVLAWRFCYFHFLPAPGLAGGAAAAVGGAAVGAAGAAWVDAAAGVGAATLAAPAAASSCLRALLPCQSRL